MEELTRQSIAIQKVAVRWSPRGRSSAAEHQLPKLRTRVRFSSPAPVGLVPKRGPGPKCGPVWEKAKGSLEEPLESAYLPQLVRFLYISDLWPYLSSVRTTTLHVMRRDCIPKSDEMGSAPVRHVTRSPTLSRLRKPSSWAWWVYLAIMTAEVPIYYLATNSVSALVYDSYGLSSAVVIYLGLRMNRPVKRGIWLAFAIGTGLFAFGDVIYYATLSSTAPTVSVANILYLAAYPAFGIGMVLLVRARTPKAQLISTLDGLIVTLGVGALAWTFVLGQYARDETMSVAARFVAIIYPTLDILLVVFIVRLVFSAGVRNISYRLLLSSVVAMLAADTLSTFATVHNWFSLSFANPIDIGWLASYALWGASALHPSMVHLAEAFSVARDAALALGPGASRSSRDDCADRGHRQGGTGRAR